MKKLGQLIVSLAVVASALAAGLVAAGMINAPILSGPTGTPRAAATSDRGSNGPPSPRATAVDSAAPGEVAVLVGASDIAHCDRFQDELTADLVESIPGIVFTVGDNANPDGTAADYRECYAPTWGRPGIKERTRPAPGDNDYDTPGARAYFDYFGDAAGDPATGDYAYDAGGWRVYVLNSECVHIGGCGAGSAQEAWLLAKLAAEPRDCIIAMWHRPYFTSGPSGGGSSAMRNLWRILQEAGAELVLSGHDHHYERFEPQTGNGTVNPNGIVQFIVGTGGDGPDNIEVSAPNSVVSQTDVFGVLRLELMPDRYAFEFISVAGPHFSDSGTGTCHGAPAS